MGCIQTKLQKRRVNRLTKENTPFLDFDNKLFWAKCVDVYDGDTITIAFYLHKHPYKVKCRLADIDCAEIRTKNDAEKEMGIKARERLKGLILNKPIYIRAGKWDKYGRLLILIKLAKNDETINYMLCREGLAYHYDGKAKREFSEWCVRAR